MRSAAPSVGPAPGQEGATLRPFGSEADLQSFGREVQRDIDWFERQLRRAPPPPPPSPPGSESITSVQTEGVDAGRVRLRVQMAPRILLRGRIQSPRHA